MERIKTDIIQLIVIAQPRILATEKKMGVYFIAFLLSIHFILNKTVYLVIAGFDVLDTFEFGEKHGVKSANVTEWFIEHGWAVTGGSDTYLYCFRSPIARIGAEKCIIKRVFLY